MRHLTTSHRAEYAQARSIALPGDRVLSHRQCCARALILAACCVVMPAKIAGSLSNPKETIVGQSIAIKFGEEELSALNARADAVSKRDASDWEEAVDWGVPDCSALCASEWRTAAAPDFD